MTLAELLATPAHAETLARQLIVTGAIFGAALEVYEPDPILDLLTALVWDLAQRRGDLGDVPGMLSAGARELMARLPLKEEETRAALQASGVDQELRAWANSIDALFRNGLLSELIERQVASSHDPPRPGYRRGPCCDLP